MTNLENLVTSLEFSKRLWEAGVLPKDFKSYAVWTTDNAFQLEWHMYICKRREDLHEYDNTPAISAPSLQELMEVIGLEVHLWKHPKGWVAEHFLAGKHQLISDNPLKALEALGEYLFDNNLWK